jgi:hypothetical protein
VEYCVLVVLLNGWDGRTPRTPMKIRGRQVMSALRDNVAEIRKAAISQYNVNMNKKIREEMRSCSQLKR